MRNIDFAQSELIKSEVDEMEDPSYHFEASETQDPICGRNISGNELSTILEVLENQTSFSIKYDDESAREALVIEIPLARVALISAEIEQELFFAWDSPTRTSWSTDDCSWPRGITTYTYIIGSPKLPKPDPEQGQSPEFYKERFLNLFFRNKEKNGKRRTCISKRRFAIVNRHYQDEYYP